MSKIEWTGKTWNPVVGCRRVSPGCDNCYAILESHRKNGMFPHYAGVTINDAQRVDWTGRYNVAPDHIFEKPVRTTSPTTWFVNSMSDLFGEGVDDATIKRVFAMMNATPHHTYQILTKRPNRAVRIASELRWSENIWMGTSIESDKYAGRADYLRKIPAAVRFISAEPLLGPLHSLDLTDIDWLIAGGESGRSRDKIRPMSIDWVRDLRDRCIEAKVAFFFKQWGNYDERGLWHRKKDNAGRELDGRTWDEMPTPRASKSVEAGTSNDNERRGWSSILEFRNHLASEHALEDAPPVHNDDTPRRSLREPIWKKLRDEGPMTGEELRDAVLRQEGLDPASPRLVNYHAWALVDLQAGGYVESFLRDVAGKRGRTKRVKMYRAIKPRIRVKAA